MYFVKLILSQKNCKNKQKRLRDWKDIRNRKSEFAESVYFLCHSNHETLKKVFSNFRQDQKLKNNVRHHNFNSLTVPSPNTIPSPTHVLSTIPVPSPTSVPISNHFPFAPNYILVSPSQCSHLPVSIFFCNLFSLSLSIPLFSYW